MVLVSHAHPKYFAAVNMAKGMNAKAKMNRRRPHMIGRKITSIRNKFHAKIKKSSVRKSKSHSKHGWKTSMERMYFISQVVEDWEAGKLLTEEAQVYGRILQVENHELKRHAAALRVTKAEKEEIAEEVSRYEYYVQLQQSFLLLQRIEYLEGQLAKADEEKRLKKEEIRLRKEEMRVRKEVKEWFDRMAEEGL